MDVTEHLKHSHGRSRYVLHTQGNHIPLKLDQAGYPRNRRLYMLEVLQMDLHFFQLPLKKKQTNNP